MLVTQNSSMPLGDYLSLAVCHDIIQMKIGKQVKIYTFPISDFKDLWYIYLFIIHLYIEVYVNIKMNISIFIVFFKEYAL